MANEFVITERKCEMCKCYSPGRQFNPKYLYIRDNVPNKSMRLNALP